MGRHFLVGSTAVLLTLPYGAAEAQTASTGAADSVKIASNSVTTDTAALHAAYLAAARRSDNSARGVARLEESVARLASRVDYLDGVAKAKVEGDVARARVRFSISVKVLNETVGQVDRLQNAFDIARAVGEMGSAANPLAYPEVSSAMQTLGSKLTGNASDRIGDFTSLLSSAAGFGSAVNPLIGGVVSLVTTMFSQRINENVNGISSAREKTQRVLCAVNNTTGVFALHQQALGRINTYRARLVGLRGSGSAVFDRAAALVGDTSSYGSYVNQLQIGNPRLPAKIDAYFSTMRAEAVIAAERAEYPKGYAEANAVVGAVREYVDHYEQMLAEVDAFYAEAERFGLKADADQSSFPACPALSPTFESNLANVRQSARTARSSFQAGYIRRRTTPEDRRELFGGV